jgi:hypothetical protein
VPQVVTETLPNAAAEPQGLRASEPQAPGKPQASFRPHQGSSSSSSIFPSKEEALALDTRVELSEVAAGPISSGSAYFVLCMVAVGSLAVDCKVLVENLRQAIDGQTRQIAESIASLGFN